MFGSAEIPEKKEEDKEAEEEEEKDDTDQEWGGLLRDTGAKLGPPANTANLLTSSGALPKKKAKVE